MVWRDFLFLFAGYIVARNIAFRMWTFISTRNMEAINNEVFAKVQLAQTDWHAGQLGGETIRRVVRAMWGYDAITDAFVTWFGPAFIVLFGLSSLMCWHAPLAGIVALATTTLFIGTNVYLTYRYIQPANQRSNALDAELCGLLSDVLSANATIKSFAAEHRETARIAAITAAWRNAIGLTWRRFIDLGLMQNVSLLLLLAGVSGAMLRAWSRSEAGPGDIAFSITAFMLMSGYLKNIGDNIRLLQRGIDDLSDAVSLSRAPLEQVSRSGDVNCPRKVSLTFEQVTFTYPGKANSVCENLSFHVQAGETIAILGASGAGKSTLIKLLQRLYTPDGGRILLNDQDVAQMPLTQLRRTIAVAPQHPELLHRSVLENIAYGNPDVAHDTVVAVAKDACAHGFISELPEGYDTLVGEKGAKLSGGQRQRVALARALLVDAPVLVLDEITSALDTTTEQQVLEGIRSHTPGRTCVVITHRESTARIADRVFEFVDGNLVEVERNAAVAV